MGIVQTESEYDPVMEIIAVQWGETRKTGPSCIPPSQAGSLAGNQSLNWNLSQNSLTTRVVVVEMRLIKKTDKGRRDDISHRTWHKVGTE